MIASFRRSSVVVSSPSSVLVVVAPAAEPRMAPASTCVTRLAPAVRPAMPPETAPPTPDASAFFQLKSPPRYNCRAEEIPKPAINPMTAPPAAAGQVGQLPLGSVYLRGLQAT